MTKSKPSGNHLNGRTLTFVVSGALLVSSVGCGPEYEERAVQPVTNPVPPQQSTSPPAEAPSTR